MDDVTPYSATWEAHLIFLEDAFRALQAAIPFLVSTSTGDLAWQYPYHIGVFFVDCVVFFVPVDQLRRKHSVNARIKIKRARFAAL